MPGTGRMWRVSHDLTRRLADLALTDDSDEDEVIEASGGSVVVVPSGEVHGFTASPGGPLRMTCLHLNDRMITEWVEPR